MGNLDKVEIEQVRFTHEAKEKMLAGEPFLCYSVLSDFNRTLLDDWMGKYSYERTKFKRGIDLYEPRKEMESLDKDMQLKMRDAKEEKKLHKYVNDMSIIGEIIEAKRKIAQQMLIIKTTK